MRSLENKNSSLPLTRYQGAKRCQITLLLVRQAVVSNAPSVRPSQKELASNAVPLPQRVSPSAVSMVEPQLAQELSTVDNVAPTLKPFMALKRAKRELNEA